MRIFLEFDSMQSELHRRRLDYAFRVFCAIYGHRPVFDSQDASISVWITYCGTSPQLSATPMLRLSNLYEARPKHVPAPPPQAFEKGGESTALFYFPPAGAQPDWLAEIFEWLSSADEYSITRRDPIGRIRFQDSYLGRHRLNVRIPYAAVAMRFLQSALCSVVPGLSLDPTSPVAGTSHFVVNTHDMDLLPAGYFKSLGRLTRNALASLLVFKLPWEAALQAGKAVWLALGGPNPLDQTERLLRAQTEQGVEATYFFIAGCNHRRDANYHIDDPDVLSLMQAVCNQGMEVGLHGSYTSLDDHLRLSEEFKAMRALGFEPRGSRQHWLRFTLDQLIPAVERTGALYDASLGWDCLGFRAGACFAFPPYNFAEERAANFLEIPLVIMEMSLLREGLPREEWYDLAADLLSVSRRYGWGGISVLWHPTAFGASQLPAEIERIYWALLEQRHKWNDTWVSAIKFHEAVRSRYADAGLLGKPPDRMPELEFELSQSSLFRAGQKNEVVS
jgi:hypothetical protein